MPCCADLTICVALMTCAAVRRFKCVMLCYYFAPAAKSWHACTLTTQLAQVKSCELLFPHVAPQQLNVEALFSAQVSSCAQCMIAVLGGRCSTFESPAG